MNEEQQLKYQKETGKDPFYKNRPSDDYNKWLEREEMKEAIQMVIDEEENQKSDNRRD